jgi:hypothetical protein
VTLLIFQSVKTPELFGFTADASGTNLPAACGPWKRMGDAIPLGVAMASASPAFGTHLDRYGFALVKGHSVSPLKVQLNRTVP